MIGDSRRRNEKVIFLLCFLSLFFFPLLKFLHLEKKGEKDKEMLRASQIMAEAISVISECRHSMNIDFDSKADINDTGLIGLEYSPITTSLGSLEAKRTTTNPNFAGLLVFLLKKAGVREGEAVAVGASSSFPALMVAALSAAKAMNLRMLMICSLGSSQWGANNPRFTWLEMQNCLLRAGLFLENPIAISLGGEQDVGKDMTSEGRALLREKIKKEKTLFLQEPDLRLNVQARMRIYEEKARLEKIRAFINIGGNLTNLGTDPVILKIEPGLVTQESFSASEKRGIIHEMALRQIPVIHLLYIRGLAQKYGLPWDPAPLSLPGQGEFWNIAQQGRSFSFVLLIGIYVILFLLIIFSHLLTKQKIYRAGI